PPAPRKNAILALARLRLLNAAAQTRTVSLEGIRPDSRGSMRHFKQIFCDDISEFESYMPRDAVRSPPGRPDASPRRGRAVSSQTPDDSAKDEARARVYEDQ